MPKTKIEIIQHAAIQRSDGAVFTGKKHADIFVPNESAYDSCIRGFVTSTGRFVSRQHAADIAYEGKQIPPEHYELIKDGIGLISENLWEYCGFSYVPGKGYYKPEKKRQVPEGEKCPACGLGDPKVLNEIDDYCMVCNTIWERYCE